MWVLGIYLKDGYNELQNQKQDDGDTWSGLEIEKCEGKSCWKLTLSLPFPSSHALLATALPVLAVPLQSAAGISDENDTGQGRRA